MEELPKKATLPSIPAPGAPVREEYVYSSGDTAIRFSSLSILSSLRSNLRSVLIVPYNFCFLHELSFAFVNRVVLKKEKLQIIALSLRVVGLGY